MSGPGPTQYEVPSGLPDIVSLATQLWGKATRRAPGKVEFGSRGSKCVQPAPTNTWFDHEAKTGGGYLDLYKMSFGRLPDPLGFPIPPGMAKELGDPVAWWDYHDAARQPIARVARFHPPGRDKTYRQFRRDGDRWRAGMKGLELPLYHLPELLQAPDGSTICVSEGEKHADQIRAWGMLATTNAGGAKKFGPNQRIRVPQGEGKTALKPIADVWLHHTDRRQFIGGVIFDPAGRHARPDMLNLWQGFAMKPSPGRSWARLEDHILKIVCGGEPPDTRGLVVDVLYRGYVYKSKYGLEDHFAEWHDEMTTEVLFASYTEFAKTKNERHPMDREAFGRFMVRMGAKSCRPRNAVVGERVADVKVNDYGDTRRKAELVKKERGTGYSLGSLATSREAFTRDTGLTMLWAEHDIPD